MSETATISAIRESCILVSFSGGYYNWKRRDRSAESEYAAHKGVASNVGEYRKNLFAGTDALLASTKALITDARAFHYSMTLPSPYEGETFLRNVAIQRYREGIVKFQHKLDTLNHSITAQWPAMVEAARTVLGPLFNASDYPTTPNVCSANYIKIIYKPIPSGENIILSGLDASVREEIRTSVDKEVNASFKAANLAAWKRLMDVIGNAKLNLQKSSPTDGRFRTEWYDNLTSLLEIMDGLNITNDADLAEFSEQAHKLIRYSPDTLRASSIARSDIAKVADKIHSDMSTIFASFGS